MKQTKVAIIGSGSIGTTIAYTLFLHDTNLDICLVNRNYSKAWAKAFDISHCSPFRPGQSIRSMTVDECVDADIIVMTAGALPRPDGTRADVMRDNIAIFNTLVPVLAANNPDAVFINITNPVDAMAYAIQRIGTIPAERVLGTGTELDRMRLKWFLQKEYSIPAEKIDIEIIGEHGDSMVPVWSRAGSNDDQIRMRLSSLTDDEKDAVLTTTKRAGWEIRKAGEHSCYAIAYTAVRLIEAVTVPSPDLFLISSLTRGEYGLSGVFMSLPARMGQHGIIEKILPELDDHEKSNLLKSYDVLKKQLETVDSLL